METTAGVSVLARLERAEQDARERRLGAQADAAGEVESAIRSAREIEAGAPARAAEAVAKLREDHLQRARAEIAAIEAELAMLAERDLAGLVEPERLDRAVEHVVAAVLGET